MSDIIVSSKITVYNNYSTEDHKLRVWVSKHNDYRYEHKDISYNDNKQFSRINDKWYTIVFAKYTGNNVPGDNDDNERYGLYIRLIDDIVIKFYNYDNIIVGGHKYNIKPQS